MTCKPWNISRMAALVAIVLAATTLVAARPQPTQTRPYFPARGEWRKQPPAAVGLDKAKLDEAIAFAVARENPNTKILPPRRSSSSGARRLTTRSSDRRSRAPGRTG